MAQQMSVAGKMVSIAVPLLMAVALLIAGAGSKAVGTSVSGDVSSTFSGVDGGDNVWAVLPGSVQLTATDSPTGSMATKPITVMQNVNPCATPIVLTPPTLAGGLTGARYEQTFTASGGCAPYTFSVSAGALPPGLTLSPTGVISGIPTQPGDFSVTIKVIDSCGCMLERSYPLMICAATRPRTYRAGNMDEFMLPTDAATPSLALKAAFPTAIWKNFDDVTIDHWVGHTFTGLPANIVKAELEVRMQPGQSSLSSNDSINLTFSPNPPLVAWGIHMADIPANLLHTWNPGDPAQTFTFDLAALPTSPSGTVNLLNDLAARRYIDLAIQDDTKADYIKLRVWTCPQRPFFFGLPHDALGQAQLSKDANGNLVVSNIGPSGNDGARIELGEAGGMGFTIESIDIRTAPVGAFKQWKMRGVVDEVPDQPAWTERHEVAIRNGSTVYQVSLDSSPLGATMNEVEVFLNGNIVFSGTFPNGDVYHFLPDASSPPTFSLVEQWDKTCVVVRRPPPGVKVRMPNGVVITQYDAIAIYADNPTKTFSFRTAVESTAAGIPQTTLMDEVLMVFGLAHHALGQATFEAFNGNLSVVNLGSGGQDGVTVDLGKAVSCDFTLDPLDSLGSASVGSYIQVSATGLLDGVPDRSLGNFRVTKTNTAYLITADLSAVAPLQRIQIYNGVTLVLDLPGHTGPAGTTSALPRKIGKLGGQTDCITSHYPPGTTFIVDGTTYHGDQFNVLADGAGGKIGFKSAFTIQAAGLDEFTISGAQVVACAPPVISCPVNITRSTTPGQCSAAVTYNTTATATCGSTTVLCSPASGSVFPKGTTTVNCTAIDSAENTASCSFTVKVFDTEPPMFPNGCPAVTVTAPAKCPIATSALVNYAMPIAADNCPGATVNCNPPPGSMFAVGTTVVTCTATDGSGNTAQCTFPVNVFSFCLQDENSAGNAVLVDALTGDYSFCCGGVLLASGRGTLTIRGCIGTIDQTKGDRRVHIQWDTSANSGAGAGTASVQKLGGILCQIADKKLSNNSCQCF